jgi:hypothetical protein
MKVKEFIALLQQQDPEARVLKYNDGGTTQMSDVKEISAVPIKTTDKENDAPGILIE